MNCVLFAKMDKFSIKKNTIKNTEKGILSVRKSRNHGKVSFDENYLESSL